MPEGREQREQTATCKGVLLLVVGDTHGDFGPLFEAARCEPEARAILQVGDLTAGKAGREQRPDDDPAMLKQLPVPLVWVHGNHEHWEVLGLGDEARVEKREPRGSGTGAKAGGDRAAPGASVTGQRRRQDQQRRQAQAPGHHLWPGETYVVPGTEITIAGLPGNYAPTWYYREKPFPGDRVRHFNVADVEAVHRHKEPSVLLMHEAFRGQAPGRIGAMGIPVLARLVRMIQPRVCLTGHHHAFAVTEPGPTLAIALPRAQQGYVRLWFTPRGERLGWELVSFNVSRATGAGRGNAAGGGMRVTDVRGRGAPSPLAPLPPGERGTTDFPLPLTRGEGTGGKGARSGVNG
ncbi:MAG: metallophosphoesterase [Chloroflexi bacterium]|nr:metallophosphoesterase [Chloroflexota bacterium]